MDPLGKVRPGSDGRDEPRCQGPKLSRDTRPLVQGKGSFFVKGFRG